MSDIEKNVETVSTEEKEVVSRNFIEQLIDKDLAEGGYFFVWFMYAIKIETMIPRIIRTTVSSS